METRSGRCLGERSLPGVRQGMSGAGAGHDSMRDVGGRRSTRRAPVVQEVSAQQQPQRSQIRSPIPPTEGAEQELQPALTQAGLPRRRMKWTTSMNETILRTYFTVTNLGQNTIGYRQELHETFCRTYPHLNVTEQRVADQYRVIIRNGLIPETRVNAIKNEVAREIGIQNMERDDQALENNEAPAVEETGVEQGQQEPRDQEHDLSSRLEEEIRRSITEYSGTDPLSRPVLPRLSSSKKLATVVSILNTNILPEFVAGTTCLESLHTIIYCAAISAAKCVGAKVRSKQECRRIRRDHPTPRWEQRLQGKIDGLRRDIGRLTEYIGGSRTRRLNKTVKIILNKNRAHAQHNVENVTVQQCLDTLRQKLSVYASRLRRYKDSNKRKQDNALFKRSEKGFYRSLNSSGTAASKNYPSKDVIQDFWKQQLASPVHSNPTATWIDEESMATNNYNEMRHEPLATEEIADVIKNLCNWKAPGLDGVHNYWLKKLWCTHEKLTLFINEIVSNPQTMPLFLTQGATYLLPKDQLNLQDPAKYRPITCLPTLYKVITACIAQRIYDHCEQNNIIADQQKGCTKNAMGCKEQLIIDSVICNQAYSKKRNLFMAYVDYKKAFDSVPHDWLIQVMKIYKIDPLIVNFLGHAMSTWSTKIHLNEADCNIATDVIRIKRGIFQGDSLSPLWFCLAMNPLSRRLNSTNYGFAIRCNNTEAIKVSHLLYMDDLKLMAATKQQLDQMLKIVEEFSTDIQMQFGLDKCRTLHLVKGKIQQADFQMRNGDLIKAMQEGDSYKYLGMKQAQRIDQRTMKEELTNEFIKRVRQVLKTKLNSKNLFQAINTYACSVLGYSFGVVSWSKTDIDSLQRKVRTLLTKFRNHHPKSAIERTTLPRNEGGRGLVDIGRQLDQQIANLRAYFYRKSVGSELHRVICQVDDGTPLRLKENQILEHHKSNNEKLQIWREKPLHGRHPNETTQEHVDKAASNYWLVSGQMFPETEGFLLAIQDQVIPTRNYLKYIAKDPTVENDKCRYGCQTSETIQHVTGGCQVFASTEYKERHDAVAKIVHQELALKLQLLKNDKVPYYNYTPEPILENDNYKLYWDRTILTDQTVTHNRPDLLLVDRETKRATLIEVAIPNTNNLTTKHVEKIAKYRDLEVRLQRQWQMRTVRTVPIILSSTGVIPKNLKQSIKELGLDEHLYKKLQKAVLLSTSRTVRRFVGHSNADRHHGPDNMERAPTELNPFDI